MLPKCCSEMGSVGRVVVVEGPVDEVEVMLVGGVMVVVTSVGGVTVVMPVEGVPVETSVGGVPVEISVGVVVVVEVVVSISIGAMLKSMDMM